MKKTLITLSLLVASVFASFAQGLGVRVAWDYSVPVSSLPGIDSGSGFTAGLVYDVPLCQNLFFEPGASFFYDTFDQNYFELQVGGLKVGPEGTLHNYGFRAPFMFGYRFDLVDDISMSVITGPQVTFGLSAKMHYDDKMLKDQQLYDYGWHRWDAEWAFGVRMHYQDNFFAEITGAIGMTNLLDKHAYDGAHIRRNLVNIGVGYCF